MIQIYLLLQKVYRMYKILHNADICHHNHIFKVVKVISQRSVKNILSLLTQREGSILLCSSEVDLLGVLWQWRNYYGLRPGEPGGPQPQSAKWGPSGLGDRAKTLARASDMLQCRFLTIRIL